MNISIITSVRFGALALVAMPWATWVGTAPVAAADPRRALFSDELDRACPQTIANEPTPSFPNNRPVNELAGVYACDTDEPLAAGTQPKRVLYLWEDPAPNTNGTLRVPICGRYQREGTSAIRVRWYQEYSRQGNLPVTDGIVSVFGGVGNAEFSIPKFETDGFAAEFESPEFHYIPSYDGGSRPRVRDPDFGRFKMYCYPYSRVPATLKAAERSAVVR